MPSTDMTLARGEIVAIWLDALYEALRAAEARAADARRSPLERHAAAMSARHLAGQIIRQEHAEMHDGASLRRRNEE